jgi:acetyl-CoA acetyltransferase
VIVGIGLSDYPKAPHLTAVQHHAQALQRALADCGIAKSAIDGYCGAGGMVPAEDPVTMAEYLGIKHRYIDGTMVGGSSFEFHVQHAAEAIRTGLCDTVLISYGSDFLSRMGRTLGTGGMFRGGRHVAGPSSSRRPTATRWSAAMRWSRAATCTSSAPPRSSSPRSRSACASTRS